LQAHTPTRDGMFHVKHSDRVEAEPGAIARAVRNRIEPALKEIGLDSGEILDRLEKFAASLALWGAKTNLTAHPNDPAEIAFHVLDSMAPIALARSGKRPYSELFEAGSRIVDIGSGAGFPGLVVASMCAAEVVLIEPRRKRASFLEAAAADMGLRNVRVRRSRVADLDAADRFDLVTARAVRPDEALMTDAARILRPGGLLLIYAGIDQAIVSRSSADSDFEPAQESRYELDHADLSVTRRLVHRVRR
jgi:16S rRNA (guanine527-N7)-methyltransferase